MSHQVPLAGLRSAVVALALALSACGGGDDAPPANPAPNQAPIARAGADRTVNEGAAVQLDGSTSNDPNGSIAQYEWTQTAGPAVTLANANTAVASFTAPATTAALSLTFTLEVTDEPGATDSDDVVITVRPVNQAPVANDDAASTTEDTAVVVDVLANDTDADDAASTSDPAQINPASVVVSAAQNGTATVDPATGRVTFAPAANFSGSASVRYTVRDTAGALSNLATVAITVSAVNDAPVAVDDAAVTAEDSAVTINVLANDSDVDSAIDPASVTTSSVANGTLAVDPATGAVTFTPAANFSGTTSFTYQFKDAQGAVSNPATVSVTVNAVNDAPTISAIADQSTDEDTPTGAIAFTAGDVETPAESLAVTAVSDNGTLVPASGIVLGGTGAERTITLTPASDEAGTATIAVTVSDGAASTDATFVLTVAPVNDAPQAFDDGAIGNEDEPIEVAVLDNDVDNDSALDPASIAIKSENHGVATVTSAGAVSFLADANFFGAAGFTYTVRDVEGAESNVAAVAVTVNPVSDAPIAGDASFTVDEDPAQPLTGQLTATDADGDTVTFRLAAGPAQGTASVNMDGSFSYSPNTNVSGTDSFTFVASDGTSDSAPASVAIRINAQGEATLTVSDVTVGEAGGALTFTVVLSRAPDAAVTVTYQTADGTAQAGSDYQSVAGTLQFDPAGPSSQVISVPVNEDDVDEQNESLTVNLTVTAGAASLESASDLAGQGTIRDNDGPAGDALDPVSEGCFGVLGGTQLDVVCEVVETLVALFDEEAPAVGGDSLDVELAPAVAQSVARGCEFLDANYCLFPFPNDFFTTTDGTTDTGRRVNLNPLAMPRNSAGRPIDPTEWNRNDGFSVGAPILARVSGLSLTAPAYGASGQVVPVQTAIQNSLEPNSAIVVVDATPGPSYGRHHLVWAELDVKTTGYTPCDYGAAVEALAEVGAPEEMADFEREFRAQCHEQTDTVAPQRAAADPADDPARTLIIRPGVNFEEGHRYVVALRGLRNAEGTLLPAPAGFRVYRDGVASALPQVEQRREAMDNVLDVLDDAGVARNDLYLAWDFTVISERNMTERLLGIRDDAFNNYLPELPNGAPEFTITRVSDFDYDPNRPDCRDGTNPADANGNRDGGANVRNCIAREVQGIVTVPNYIGQPQLPRDTDQVPGSSDLVLHHQAGARFHYQPGPENVAADGYPLAAAYGDGIPDRVPGAETATFTFTCRIPRAAFGYTRDKTDAANDFDVQPARPSLYGHGLFGTQNEVRQSQLQRFANEHGFMFCATDWMGLSGTMDVVNAATILLDASNFPTLTDRIQQADLNWMFLARLLKDEHGFKRHPAFQAADGRPVIDNREVFYDGNSQGGINGGVVVAASPDIQRGVLGVPGMNYSTLLQRSVDYDAYGKVMYTAYPDPMDQQFVFGLLQMLWDRSENNGYAQHLGDGVEPGGQIGLANQPLRGLDDERMAPKQVLLHPAFGDHQVSMWSAEVMARTTGAITDRTRVSASRHPDGANAYFGLEAGTSAGAGTSAMVVWDEPWSFDSDSCGGEAPNSTPPPPLGNSAPAAGDDPHECPRREAASRCQKARFLRTDGRFIDVTGLTDPALCPTDGFGGDAPPLPPGTVLPPPALGFLDALAAAVQQFATALGAGDAAGALAAVQTAGGLVVVEVTTTIDDMTGVGTGPEGLWLAGDMHVHDDHSSDGSLARQTFGDGAGGNTSVADQIAFAETVGLDFLPLTDHRTFDQHYDPQWTSGKLLLITGEEANSGPHANVFGALDMINQGTNPAGVPEVRRLQQSIWDAHSQGAAWQTNHPDDGVILVDDEDRPVRDANGDVMPNGFAAAAGPDLVEVWNRGTWNGPKIEYAENRWNAGFRFGIAGASDNHFKELWPVAGPGAPTTHVLVSEPSTAALLEALRAGRTVINRNDAAPFVTLTGDFDGDGRFETVGGDERIVPAGRTVKLRVSVTNGAGNTVKVYRSPGRYSGTGKAFQTFKPQSAAQNFTFPVTADKAQDWYRVEVRGLGDPDAADYKKVQNCDAAFEGPDPSKCQADQALEDDPDGVLRAITAPIFISTDELAKPESPGLPADQGQADGAVAAFGSAGDNAFAGFARIAEANGIAHIVAEVRQDGDSAVMYRKRLADGTLTAPVEIASHGARQPAIAAWGSHVWIVWQQDRYGEKPRAEKILFTHSYDSGDDFSRFEVVTEYASGRQLRPDIALIDPTLAVIAWEGNEDGVFDIWATKINAYYNPYVVPFKVSGANKPGTGIPTSVGPRIAVRADGAVAIAWQDNRDDKDPGWTFTADSPPDAIANGGFTKTDDPDETDDWEIYAATTPPIDPENYYYDELSFSAPVNVSKDPARADRHATVAFDNLGKFHVAWDSKDKSKPAGPNLEIRERRSADLGGQWDATSRVTSDSIASAQRPSFGRLGTGLNLLWTDGRAADWRWRVMRAAANDAGFGETTAVTGPGNGTWAAYDNGFLVFTTDRAATREQRKPQQVFFMSLDASSPTPSGDLDGDGVLDEVDDCPRLGGNVDEYGCPIYEETPDADGDGVPDADDACPNQPGSGVNRGCYVYPVTHPVCGFGTCVSELPVVGSYLQQVVETAYDLLAPSEGTTRPQVGLFKVGTGQADQNPKERVCFGSGTFCSHSADPTTEPNAIRDDLYARATAITGVNGQTFIVVATTNIGYFLAYKPEQSGMNGIYDVRLRIAQATGVPSTHIVVVSDHSHNGPDTIGIWGGVSANYMKLTADAVVSAAVQAWESRRPAVIKVAAVNQNHNMVPGVPLLDSSAYQQAPANDLERGNPYNEFRLLVADDAKTGERILTFANYAPHATVSNGDTFGGKYRITGDWASWMPQEAERIYGGMGMGTIATVGGTDWHPDETDRNHDGTDIDDKEREARQRLRTLMAAATAKLEPVSGASVQVQSTFIRETLMQPALWLNYKPGVDHNLQGTTPVTDASNGMDLRIDRSVLPPFLTGDVLGTYVSAIRIGDVFISTFPGEPFGELDHALQDEGRVAGARVQFLLGGANDFFGYMVKNLDTYQHIAQSSGLWLSGACPDKYVPGTPTRPEGEGGCADHWTLMVSPTFGSHIVCTLQNQADQLGFTTANRDDACPVYTALDGLGAPPESGSSAAMASLEGRQAAVEQARALAALCRDTQAPDVLCAALADGAHQAEIYLGTEPAGDAVPPPDRDGDGVPDAQDAFPDDPAESADADGDGVGNSADTDDDNDGIADTSDECAGTPANTEVDVNGCPHGKPTYADLCEGYGIEGSEPACGLLAAAETQLREECESNNPGGPQSFCTLSGGNLHALIDACYDASDGDSAERRDGRQLAVCRIADAVVTGAAGWCRQVSQHTGDVQREQFCALIGGQHVGEYQMQAFENSWVHKALRLQNRLGYDLPLIHTSLIATHNSFNAMDDNTPPTLSGSDSNQLYDVKDQLRMGVRTIELDIHWVPSLSPSRTDAAGADTQLREPVVCHGLSASEMHGGCTNERPLAAVLKELRTWLDANPNETLYIYVEPHLSGPGAGTEGAVPFDQAAARFAEVLGDLIWQPNDTQEGRTCPATAGAFGAESSWLNVTPAQIVGANKQVLIMSDACGSGSAGWDGLMHKKDDGQNVAQYGSHVGAAYGSNCVYERPIYGQRWTRVWDDSTLVNATDAEQMVKDREQPDARDEEGPITPVIARELMRCGMQMPSLDQLAPFDGRLEAMVWSWAPNEPSTDAGKDCALHNAAGRLVAAQCPTAGDTRRYACVDAADPTLWSLTDSSTACFSVPVNGYANEKLKEAKAAAGLTEVWVNYHRDSAAYENWASDHSALGAGTPRGNPQQASYFEALLALVGGLIGDIADALVAADVEAALSALVDAAADFAAELGRRALGSIPGVGDVGMRSDCSDASWIGGTTELCNGVLTYRDYVYDDHGADTQASYLSPIGQLSPVKGNATYPSDQENTADLVKLTLVFDNGRIRVAAELNTLYVGGGTQVLVAVDADNDDDTGNVTLAKLRVAGADAIYPLTQVDAATNVISGSFPAPPGSWKVWAVVAQADGTVMNVAFRGTEEQAQGLTREDAVGGTWWEDRQASALAAGDITAFGHVVATADLVNGVTRFDTIRPGLHERIYTSAYTLDMAGVPVANGEGVSTGGVVDRDGDNGYPCEQRFHFLGKYQPYGLYIPGSYDPSATRPVTGVQLAMHGCEANHASLINASGMQQKFGENLDRILVVPLGRGPVGFYSDLSERDVLDVIADVQASYAHDPDRVFAGGYSMGGYGTLRMAALYPDLFAGAVNWVGFTGDVFNVPMPGRQGAIAQFTETTGNSSTGAIGNVIEYIGNLRHIPSVNLYAGADELVQVHTGFALQQRFTEADVPYVFYMHPAADHLTMALLDDWTKEALDSAAVERVRNPARVTYRTDRALDHDAYGIRHDRAYWVSAIVPAGAGYADVDLRTQGCGRGDYALTDDPPLVGFDAVTSPGSHAPLSWERTSRTRVAEPSVAGATRLTGALTNVSELTIDVAAACLAEGELQYQITTSTPVTIHFTDGRDDLVWTAGTHDNLPAGNDSGPDAGECLVSLDPTVCSAVASDPPTDPAAIVNDLLTVVLGDYADTSIEHLAPQAGTWPESFDDDNWEGAWRGPFRNDQVLPVESQSVDEDCPAFNSPESIRECAATRPYYMYEPTGYDAAPAAAKLPLIVYLHGCNQTAKDAAIGTRWNALADAQHFLVAYPEQRRDPMNSSTNQGNSLGCWNWYDPVQGQGNGLSSAGFGYFADEPAIIAEIISVVSGHWNVDTDRIYVLGASAGADMSVVMGVNYADTVAAIGALAGCGYPDCATPPEVGGALIAARWQGKRPVPMFAGQGTLDTLNPAAADESLVQEWLSAHDHHDDGTPNNSVSRLPAQTTAGKAEGDGNGFDYRRDVWRDADGCRVVDHYLIYGLGHAYPGGDPRGSFVSAGGPDATHAAWEFFTRFTLQGVVPGACN